MIYKLLHVLLLILYIYVDNIGRDIKGVFKISFFHLRVLNAKQNLLEFTLIMISYLNVFCGLYMSNPRVSGGEFEDFFCHPLHSNTTLLPWRV